MNRVQIATSLLFAVAPQLVFAGQIGPGDFSAAAVLQDFESLGTNSNRHMSPLLVGADTFDANDHDLTSSSKLGPVIDRSGTALRNSPDLSDAPNGFIDIALGKPAIRAGLYVGFEVSWAADVQFYDTEDILLGTLALSGNGRDNDFVAWQADTGLIQRIRVADAINDGNAIIIDDFIQEIPEPGSILLFLLGLLMSIRFRKRRG